MELWMLLAAAVCAVPVVTSADDSGKSQYPDPCPGGSVNRNSDRAARQHFQPAHSRRARVPLRLDIKGSINADVTGVQVFRYSIREQKNSSLNTFQTFYSITGTGDDDWIPVEPKIMHGNVPPSALGEVQWFRNITRARHLKYVMIDWSGTADFGYYYYVCPAAKPNSTDCADEDHNCWAWADDGYCDSDSEHSEYMMQHCKESCHMCDGARLGKPMCWEEEHRVCPMPCEHGYEQDENGCKTCQCKPDGHGIWQVKKQVGPVCAICKYAVQYLDSFLDKQSTQGEIEAGLMKVCDILPFGLKAECSSFVKQYTPMVIQLFIYFTPAEKCAALTLCEDGHGIWQVKKQVGPVCAICKYAVQYLDSFLDKQSTQGEIEAGLMKVCDILPFGLKAECSSFVKQYTPMVIQLFIYFTPAEKCAALTLCEDGHGIWQVKKQVGPVCAICKYAVQYLDSFLDKQSTQGEIEAGLIKVCDILPFGLKAECSSFVKQYTPMVIQLFIYFTPAEKCAALTLCEADQKLSQPKIAGETCAACKNVVAYYIEYYKQNTQVDIEKELEMLCNILPGGLTARCQSSVKQYTALLIQLITSGVAPQEVCAKLSLCEAPPSHHCPPLDDCFEMAGPDCEVELFTDSLGCDRCRCKDPLPTPRSHYCPPLDGCFEMAGPDCEIEFFIDHGCRVCRCKTVDPTPIKDPVPDVAQGPVKIPPKSRADCPWWVWPKKYC